jgi:hypothetical protein
VQPRKSINVEARYGTGPPILFRILRSSSLAVLGAPSSRSLTQRAHQYGKGFDTGRPHGYLKAVWPDFWGVHLWGLAGPRESTEISPPAAEGRPESRFRCVAGSNPAKILGTPWGFNTWFGAGRESILGAWAAAAAPKTSPGRSPPAFGRVSGAPGAFQTHKMANFRLLENLKSPHKVQPRLLTYTKLLRQHLNPIRTRFLNPIETLFKPLLAPSVQTA